MGSSLRIGLRRRAVTDWTAVILLTSGLLSTALILHGYQDSIVDVTRRSVINAREVAYISEPAEKLLDQEGLNHLVGVVSGDGDLMLARLLNRNGQAVATFQREDETSVETPADIAVPMKAALTRDSLSIVRTAGQLLVSDPVWPQHNTIDLGLIQGGDEHKKYLRIGADPLARPEKRE